MFYQGRLDSPQVAAGGVGGISWCLGGARARAKRTDASGGVVGVDEERVFLGEGIHANRVEAAVLVDVEAVAKLLTRRALVTHLDTYVI